MHDLLFILMWKYLQDIFLNEVVLFFQTEENKDIVITHQILIYYYS